ncbi:MAG: hypothetical protein R2873_13110 [Caldilineaceae bacterium]
MLRTKPLPPTVTNLIFLPGIQEQPQPAVGHGEWPAGRAYTVRAGTRCSALPWRWAWI